MKKEEIEFKVQQALKQWREQEADRDCPWNMEKFYCYNWNKQVLPNEDMKKVKCIDMRQRNVMTENGSEVEIISEACKQEHKCMYIMSYVLYYELMSFP